MHKGSSKRIKQAETVLPFVVSDISGIMLHKAKGMIVRFIKFAVSLQREYVYNQDSSDEVPEYTS